MPQEIEDNVPEESPADPGGDVDMTEGRAEGAEGAEGETNLEGSEMPATEEEPTNARTTFLDYLTSPIISLSIGPPDAPALLNAHQGLLSRSPYFAEVCQCFVDDGSPRQIDLPDENIDAVGSFLEFLYTGEYFPRKLPGQRVLENDPTAPSVDDTGDQLLKHARVYTLAEKFGVSDLKRLASSKIHCVNSTARGEIAYTRYVYAYTSQDDTKVRAPIASFWATRSHTLRSEVEDEFKKLCLEYPQFGYDVLTRVLDDKLKRQRNEKMHPATGSGRKRARHSSGGA
ncbi:hypothetical protein ACO1O0_002618 [Amphichorda felina]